MKLYYLFVVNGKLIPRHGFSGLILFILISNITGIAFAAQNDCGYGAETCI